MVGMVPNLKKPEIVRLWLDLLLGKTWPGCWRRIDKYWDRYTACAPPAAVSNSQFSPAGRVACGPVKTCHPKAWRPPPPGSRSAPVRTDSHARGCGHPDQVDSAVDSDSSREGCARAGGGEISRPPTTGTDVAVKFSRPQNGDFRSPLRTVHWHL